MAKQFSFNENERRLKVDVNTLTNAVKTTLGPKGRNVALDKKWGVATTVSQIEITHALMAWADDGGAEA